MAGVVEGVVEGIVAGLEGIAVRRGVCAAPSPAARAAIGCSPAQRPLMPSGEKYSPGDQPSSSFW